MSSRPARAAALVAAALCLWASPAVYADGDLVLPEGTASSLGDVPAWHPPLSREPAAVERWATALTRLGREREGTLEGADCLLSAAWAWGWKRQAWDEALALYEEVLRTAPRGSPAAIVAGLEACRLHLRRKDAAAARRTLEAARTRSQTRPPPGADLVQVRRWGAAVAALRADDTSLEIKVRLAAGDFAGGATLLEGQADAWGPTENAANAWAQAARLRARAGSPAVARDDIARALAATQNERKTADWIFWRLYLDHHLLNDEAECAGFGRRPGPTFVEDVRACLRSLPGNPHTGPWLLSSASAALRHNADEMALELYREALADRTLLSDAVGDPGLWRGLLAAFPLALRLGRLDDAELILRVVQRSGELPQEEAAHYERLLVEAHYEGARNDAKAPEESSEAVPERVASGPAPSSPARRPGRLQLADEDVSPAPATGRARDGAGGLPTTFAVAAISMAVALLLLLALRKHR